MLLKRRIKLGDLNFFLRFNPKTGYGAIVVRKAKPEELKALCGHLHTMPWRSPEADVRLVRALQQRGERIEDTGMLLRHASKTFFYFRAPMYLLSLDLKSLVEVGYVVEDLNRLGRAFT